MKTAPAAALAFALASCATPIPAVPPLPMNVGEGAPDNRIIPIEAMPRCAERAALLEALQRGHAEVSVALGLQANGGVLEILASPEGSFTVLTRYPGQTPCIVAIGKAFELIKPVAGLPT